MPDDLVLAAFDKGVDRGGDGRGQPRPSEASATPTAYATRQPVQLPRHLQGLAQSTRAELVQPGQPTGVLFEALDAAG
ncbi:hypothetical protein [Streptomyces sp. BK340]|uniref:hypothetical protein n=1 Tax=Streptomyces sp. BK340 TaxID=2572903 RepID=UPI00119F9406|nr:hypothetical protein [Streptomyces sp. BK340]